MNFNHQMSAAAAAAAAAGNPNLNMSSFASAVTSILANSNIDLSQLPGLSQLGLGVSPVQAPTSRQNLQQAHHHRSSASNNSSAGAQSLNSNSHHPHLPASLSNLQNSDPSTTVSVAGIPASLTNLNSSTLADLAGINHGSSVHSVRSSIQSAHRSSHLNHHPSSTAQLTAAHQSTSASKGLLAHPSHHTIHHRQLSSHNSSHNKSSSSLNHHHHHSSGSSNNHHNIVSNNINNSSSSNNNSINSHGLSATSTQTIIAANNSSSITPPKSSTCYRIGDCVYFETSPSMPSQTIGKIDEICRINGDNIEVKVVVFFRRRDIPSSLMTLADKYQYDETQEQEIEQMSEKDKTLLKQRELFYSRQIETIPASAIRGKCAVQLLNESESLASYLEKEDNYFYTLVYDPQQKMITADRGDIRVGQRYQAEVPPKSVYTPQAGGDPSDPRDLNELETLVYTPDHNLTDDDINKFLTIAKSVGTFARALDCSSSIKQPSLHLTAASASRDVTLLYAMQLLHQNDYDLGKAVCALVPSTGPVLCRDEIEEWTAGEATLFEEAIEKYGREFNDIRQDFLPWKSVKNIVEYYYMWKTTDRSINQRRIKALEAENKVSVIYIADPENEIKKSPKSVVALAGQDTALSTDVGKTRTIKKPPESEDSSMTPTATENTNAATLKRRQVTEPKLSTHVACHTTPGENLRFISSRRDKLMRRETFTREQYRHLSRRPWELQAKSRT